MRGLGAARWVDDVKVYFTLDGMGLFTKNLSKFCFGFFFARGEGCFMHLFIFGASVQRPFLERKK